MRPTSRTLSRPRRHPSPELIRARHFAGLRPALILLVTTHFALAAQPSRAAEDRWTIDVETVQLEISGQDRHVLTDRHGAGPAASDATVRLDTSGANAWRTEVRRAGERWSFGFDFLWHVTNQNADLRTGAADAGTERTFIVGSGVGVVSRGPGEVLYFQRLEDTTVEFWNADLVATRAIAAGPRSELRLVLGLRAADFDNDYRAVVGVEDRGGLRLDASSNYDRMHGPLLAISGIFEHGRHRFEGYLGQAVVWGDVELSSSVREFIGPPSLEVDDVPNVVDQTRFTQIESVTIPMTEARLRWRYRLARRWSIGLGAFYQRWWDLAVPPGVVAGSQLDTLAENTIEAYGAAGGITIVF